MEIKIPKGTQDILPVDIQKWYYIEEVIRKTLNRYGYHEIRTPMFEHTELFVRGIGESTDIVNKEMFTFPDRKGRSLTLRPEGTASVMRAYLENRMQRSSKVMKLFYFGPMFRCEKPQAGRFRQFNQFGIELIGSPSPLADVEIIAAALEIYKTLGLKKLQVLINSVGCKKCREDYIIKLKSFLTSKKDELCADCKNRVEKNPMRVLDCKNIKCQRIIKEAPKINDNLCNECNEHFEKVKGYLNDLKIRYKIDETLVRGLDYYTKTAFEIISGELGAQNAIAGGGRYDDLIEELGGKATPGVGFAAGIERTIISMDKQNVKWPGVDSLEVFAIVMDEKNSSLAFQLLQKIRKAGFSADMDFVGKSIKSQMRAANKYNAKYTVILGEEELSRKCVILRNMGTKEQKEVNMEYLIDELS